MVQRKVPLSTTTTASNGAACGTVGTARRHDGFAGMPPVHETLLGMVDAASEAKRQGWLDRMRDYGRRLI